MNKIFISVLFLLSLFPLFSETDKELAQLYVDEAFYYYNRENYNLSDDFIQKALQFSQDLPEAWYLSGLIREEQGNRLKSLDLYRHSISIGNAYSEYFYDLYFRYLNMLNITAHHKDVLDFYQKNKAIFDRDNKIILKVSDSAYKIGLIDYSIELASDVYKRNPYNLKSIIYLIRSSGDHEFYNNIEKSLYRLETEKLDEILFQQLILSDSGQTRLQAIQLYKSIFGETSFYYMVTDREDLSIDKSRNLMIRSAGDETLDDGVYFGDYNFDGVSDEIVTITGNELSYLKDADQDNITDLSIHFIDGVPSVVFLNKGEIGYEFKYSEYPYVDEIHFTNKNLVRVYKIFPGTKYTPLRDLASFNWKYNSNRKSIVSNFQLNPVDLLRMSYLFEETFRGNDFVFREYALKNGEVKGIKEDSQNDGIFDHFLDISAWKPESGRRDLNHDGVIDVYESYENGKLMGIAVDWNNNGKSEYIEDWSVLNIKTWDFDEDSFIDAEYIGSSGEQIYTTIPFERALTSHYDIYSWDFSNKNFWFNNN